MMSWLISSNQVEQVQKIKILLKGIFSMLEKSKKLLSWITGLSNVVFLNVDGMRHLRGREDMIPIVDYFSIDSLRYLPEDKEPYVLPIHCEQVLLSI